MNTASRQSLQRGIGAFFGLAILAGVGLFVLELAVGETDLADALLVLVAAVGVVLYPLSRSLSFTYFCVTGPLIIALNRHGGVWGPGKATFYLFLFLFMLTSIVTKLRARRSDEIYMGPTAWLVILFIAYLGGHVLFGLDQPRAFNGLLVQTYHLPFLVMPTLLMTRHWHVKSVTHFYAGLGVTIALGALVVALQTTNPIALLAHGGRYTRVHMYFGTANLLASFLSATFFVLLYAFQPKSRLLAIAKTLGMALMLMAIVFTFSRRSWLAVVVLLFFHLIRRPDWRLLVLGLVVTVGLFATADIQQIEERAESAFQPDDSTNVKRKRELTEQFEMLPGSGFSVFGWGLDHFRAASTHNYERRSENAYFHNYFLTIYYLSGLVGLLLYLALSASLYVGMIRIYRRARAPATRNLAIVGIATWSNLLFTGLFGNGPVAFPMNFVSALMPGLAFALYACDVRAQREQAESSR